MNEKEKKRAYNERILGTFTPLDHGTFTPLVFSIDGSMGRECQKFYSRLAQVISEKRDLPQSISSKVIGFEQKFAWFAKIKSVLFKGVQNSMQ